MGIFSKKKKHTHMEPTDVNTTIELALNEGARLHAFLSGGGLRVLRLEKGGVKKRDGALVGYGEHPVVEEAFRILAEDYVTGGRPYGEVYGKIETHYLTGQSQPETKLDGWVRQGNTFDAFALEGQIVFQLCGWGHHETPKDIQERAMKGEGELQYEQRGYVFETNPSRFPNGERCTSTRIVSSPEGKQQHRAWMWRMSKTGTGRTLEEAIAAAFEAAEVEEGDD